MKATPPNTESVPRVTIMESRRRTVAITPFKIPRPSPIASPTAIACSIGAPEESCAAVPMAARLMIAPKLRSTAPAIIGIVIPRAAMPNTAEARAMFARFEGVTKFGAINANTADTRTTTAARPIVEDSRKALRPRERRSAAAPDCAAAG